MSASRLAYYFVGCVCLASAATPRLFADEKPDVEFFERRIRPVLAEQCYGCHSTTAKSVKGDLRLDSRERMRRGGESGPAVVPGKPDESMLISALRHESVRMPPGRKLPDAVIADFVKWIEAGAPDPRDDSATDSPSASVPARDHWAFQPLRRPQPPNVSHSAWVRSDVDRFILDRLRTADLQPAPQAEARTLIRRAYFDLIGLPPEPEAVERFVADASPDAFRTLVDELLESPHYGERWGRYWLDVARYADNKGYVFFVDQKNPWAWTYRDYVVRAFNDDLPYDRFLLEQLAADQLELGDDRRPLTAMGFLTLGPWFMNNSHDMLDDRIDVVTRGLMALTVTCSRCHDHKYDPIPQADYYSLYGVFRSSVEPTVPPEFLLPPDSDEYRSFQQGLDERLGKLETFVEAQRKLLADGARDRAAEYLLAVHHKRNQPSTEEFMLLTEKGSLIPAMIHRWELALEKAHREGDPVWSVWHAFAQLPEETFARDAAEQHSRLFNKQPSPTASEPRSDMHPAIRAAFQSASPHSMDVVASKYGEVLRDVDTRWKARLQQSAAAGQQPPERMDVETDEQLRQVLYGPQSAPMVPKVLGWGFLDLLPDRPTQGEFKALVKEAETWSTSQPGAPPRAMALIDRDTPFDPVIFIRGNPNRNGPAVPRQLPAIVAGVDRKPFQHGSGRLELARAIAAPSNPLTARVFVNRVWQHHFGHGLVDTPSDFGLRSNPPSHPELLDWLAATFIDNGWSVKELHRLIMNSAVYQQAGEAAEATSTRARVVDPVNRRLWKFPRRRLDFEATRDSLLAVSGSLDRTIGGPAVNLWDGFVPRRSIYGFVDRLDTPVLMRTFDFPDPVATSPQREETTVPPQALYFLNNDFVTECARRLIHRADVSASSHSAEQIERSYRVLFSRPPDADELRFAEDYLRAEMALGKVDADVWLNLVQTLLMTNEFVFVD